MWFIHSEVLTHNTPSFLFLSFSFLDPQPSPWILDLQVLIIKEYNLVALVISLIASPSISSPWFLSLSCALHLSSGLWSPVSCGRVAGTWATWTSCTWLHWVTRSVDCGQRSYSISTVGNLGHLWREGCGWSCCIKVGSLGRKGSWRGPMEEGTSLEAISSPISWP